MSRIKVEAQEMKLSVVNRVRPSVLVSSLSQKGAGNQKRSGEVGMHVELFPSTPMANAVSSLSQEVVPMTSGQRICLSSVLVSDSRKITCVLLYMSFRQRGKERQNDTHGSCLGPKRE